MHPHKEDCRAHVSERKLGKFLAARAVVGDSLWGPYAAGFTVSNMDCHEMFPQETHLRGRIGRLNRRRPSMPSRMEGPMRSKIGWIVLAFCVGWPALGTVAHAAELLWWSQWSVEENKKTVLFEVKRRFEAAHPGTKVTITFYEKANMFPAVRATMTAGSGFPDVFTMDTDHAEFIEAGWAADLSRGIRWENMEPYAKAAWTRPGPGGKMGPWAVAVEATSDELYFNKKLFRQLGITVPAGYAFTQEAFKDVVAKCVKAVMRGLPRAAQTGIGLLSISRRTPS
jgi:hypothetical protein